jgi:hypothetical protein
MQQTVDNNEIIKNKQTNKKKKIFNEIISIKIFFCYFAYFLLLI